MQAISAWGKQSTITMENGGPAPVLLQDIVMDCHVCAAVQLNRSSKEGAEHDG